ncbi:MAG: response regulator [Deltaproteobacteria bacterium]|nr:response regulator [Deltaproteobacteria bacterium]
MTGKRVRDILFGTLRRQLIVGVAAVHAVMMTVFIGDLTWRQQSLILDRQAEHATALAHTLAASAAGWLSAVDISGLQELAEGLRRYPDLTYAMLLDNRGQVLAHTDRSRLGQYVLDLPADPRESVLSRSAALVDVVVPAMLSGKQVGWARVGIGQRQAGRKLMEITRNGVFYALVAVFIGSLLALLVGKRITRRLYRIRSVMDEVGAGNYQARSDLAGADEAAGMAANFNRMLDILEERDREVKRSEDRYRTLIQNIHSAIVVHGPGTEVIASNSFAQTVLGLTEEQMRGKDANDPAWSFLREDGTGMPVEEYPVSRVVATCRPVRDCVVGISRPGKGAVVWVLANAEPVVDDDGGLSRVLVNFVDITERKSLELRYIQSQKMEAVGRMAGGIAHDFNNLLTVTIGYCDLALARIGSTDPLRHDLAEIRKASDRCASLTRQLLAFSRKQILVPKVISLNGIVADMDKMLRRLLGEDIELVSVAGKGLRNVKADPGQIEQVIVNLAVNSRDAMPRGGKLTFEASNVVLDESYTGDHKYISPGPYVMLAVSDTGCGMDKEMLARIFEPFFTTKEKGTGLGLSTVYGIVKQSGGHINVYSEPGVGTTFKIYFPPVDEPVADAVRAAALPQEELRGDETVLVVEDEDLVRQMVRGILEQYGYGVLEARSGGEAIDLCSRHRGTIHLMLTDVVMPGMNGVELSKRLAPIQPGMKVLFMSGYTVDAIVHQGILESGIAFLQKPFSMDSLAHKLREVLGPGTAPRD